MGEAREFDVAVELAESQLGMAQLAISIEDIEHAFDGVYDGMLKET